MRGVFHRALFQRPLASFNAANFLADTDHGVAETVEFGLVFGFCRFHHQRATDREADGRGVEAVVHQAFGDVDFGDAGGGFQGADIENAFVGDASVVAFVEHRIMCVEPRGDVVGVEDGDARRLFETGAAHQGDVHPRDGQNGSRAPGCSGHCALPLMRTLDGLHRMVGHEGGQVRFEADGAHAGAAAAVRDGEGFVQVDVRDVSADIGGAAQADLRVEVCAVHVHLTAVAVHDGADVFHGRFKHAVGRRIGEHQAGEVGGVLCGLGAEVGHIHVAVVVTFDSDHNEAAHLRRGRVGAVGGSRNQTNVALCLALCCLIATDGDQSGVFALRAGVRLHAHGIESGDGLELIFQPGDEFFVTLRLIHGRKRVHVAEFWPRHRHHLGGGVEFHGAAAQRNHCVVERQIAVLQALQVAQHLVLGAVRVEYRMGENGVRALQCGGNVIRFADVDEGLADEHRKQGGYVVARGCFIEADADRIGINVAHIEAGGEQFCRSLSVDFYGDGVKESTGNTEPIRENRRQAVDAPGDSLQAFGAVPHGVHAGHVGQQHL